MVSLVYNLACVWVCTYVSLYIYVCIYIYKHIYIYIYIYISVSLYKDIFRFIYVSGFPSWYILMRGQTSGRGTQVNSYKSHIFVDNITVVVTTSAYIKYIRFQNNLKKESVI